MKDVALNEKQKDKSHERTGTNICTSKNKLRFRKNYLKDVPPMATNGKKSSVPEDEMFEYKIHPLMKKSSFKHQVIMKFSYEINYENLFLLLFGDRWREIRKYY